MRINCSNVLFLEMTKVMKKHQGYTLGFVFSLWRKCIFTVVFTVELWKIEIFVTQKIIFLNFNQGIKWSYRSQVTNTHNNSVVLSLYLCSIVFYCVLNSKISPERPYHILNDHITSWSTYPNDQNPNDWSVMGNIYFGFKTKYNTK